MSADDFLGLPWDDFVREWFLGNPVSVSPEESRRGLDALRRWLPDQLDRLVAASNRGPFIIEPAIRLGVRLAEAEPLLGFSELAARLANDEPGAHLELLLAAALLSLGHRPEIEPYVDPSAGSSGKRNDAAITFAGSRVHFEATRADQSEEGARAQLTAQKMGEALVAAQDCLHVLVWTTSPLQNDMIIPVVQLCKTTPLDDLVEVPGVGYLRKTNGEDQSGPEPPDIGPMLVMAHFRMENGVRRVANIRQPAIDLRLPKILDKKGAQLGPNANVVVIGVNNIPGKMADLAPQVVRRFQPALNRRFGAAVLVRSTFPMDRMVSHTELEVIPNPHATDAVPEGLLRQIASLNGTVL